MAHRDVSDEKQFQKDYYGQLVGFTVTQVEQKVEDMGGYEEVWPQITLKKGPKEIQLEVSRDEEGNGPGFLFGLEMRVRIDPNNPPPKLD